MMRKSAWLLSAALVAVRNAGACAEPSTQPTSPTPTRADATPTEGRRPPKRRGRQDQAREQQPVDTGDIVITATRRNQALSDVPMAVSAVTARHAAESAARPTSASSTSSSPSLLVSSTTSEARRGGRAHPRHRHGRRQPRPRRLGRDLFIDGVYRSRTGVGLTELGPLDRIEVLRGPQGTLFGRNASAGLISVITAKPRFTPFVSRRSRASAITTMRRFEA